MTDSAQSPASYHVLLVGIDDYSTKPLRGCVNDIDAIQKILLERVGVPKKRILRLASPRRDTSCSTEIPAKPATLENLRAALGMLAERAQKGDRVFIYYSGHGARVELMLSSQRAVHSEALVPVDFDNGPEEQLLHDHEINRFLAAIAAKTRAVSVVLDCCHSAGVTRELAPNMTSRVLEVRKARGRAAPSGGHEAEAMRGDGIARTVDDCHVVSACLNHELAREFQGNDGVTHGLLTRALVHSLEAIPDAELASVPWSRIWQAMRGEVEGLNPHQHLWMAGNAARAVLAGQPVDGDPGFCVRRAGDAYEIDAGTLASVTESAVIAVYGEQPAHFPSIDSDADRSTRLGLVHVTSARMSSAIAIAVGEPFAIPSGARGRIVAAGKAARLRCAIVPASGAVSGAVIEAVLAAVAESPLLEVVEPAHAQVRLEQAVDHHWSLTDDIHGADRGFELCALASHQLRCARDVLEHYFRYAVPLRMAESAIDLPGALQLSVRLCPEELSPEAAVTADLVEAPTKGGTSGYVVTEGAGVCFRVHNTSNEQLRVTLVNSAASGKVRILDEQSVDPGSTRTFWAGNEIGLPFEMSLPKGKRQAIDRLIAIGTTANKDVKYLAMDRSFADVISTERSNKDIIGRLRTSSSIEQWTATQVILKTLARP